MFTARFFQITSFRKFEKAQSQLYPSSSKKHKSRKSKKYEKRKKKEKCTIQSRAPGPTINHTSLLTYSTATECISEFSEKPCDFPHAADIASLGGVVGQLRTSQELFL